MKALARIRSWYFRWQLFQLSWAARKTPAFRLGDSVARSRDIEVSRNRVGAIQCVRIGSWRIITASKSRRIVSVRKLEDDRRIAVQIELAEPFSTMPYTTIWEIYDPQGRMDSMLQSTDDSSLWIETRTSEHRKRFALG